MLSLRAQVRQVTFSDALLGFVYDLVTATRTNHELEVGLSPRASLALVEASQAMAFLESRTYVTPEDVQAVFLPLSVHRVVGRGSTRGDETTVLEQVLKQTPVP